MATKQKLLPMFGLLICALGAFPQVFAQSSETLSTEPQGGYSMEQLLEAALAQAPELRLAAAQVNSARASLAGDKADFLPSLGASAAYSYLSNPQSLSLEAGALASSPLVLPEEDVEFDLSGNNYFKFGLSLSQTLFTWGKLRAQQDAGELNLALRQAEERQAQLQLESELRLLYHSISHLNAMLELLSSQLDDARDLVNLANEGFLAGFSLESDVLQARVTRGNVELALMQLTQNRDDLILRLAQLTGIESLVGSDIAGVSTEDDQEYLQHLPAWENSGEVDSQLSLSANPVLAQRSAQVDLARVSQRVAEIQARGLPDIALVIDGLYEGDQPPFSEESWAEDGLKFNASVALNSDLFNFGRDRAEVLESSADVQAALAAYDQVQQSLQRSFASLQDALAYDRAALLQAQLVISQRTLEMQRSQRLLATGSEDESAYLASRIALAEARNQLLQSGMSYLEHYFRLQTLLGR